ncbi:MAG: RHS repeat-associated core domain-containing protein, partial [Burkholderiaceae bacterium]
GLSYEKEVKANGITEHKHYLSAGGMVFALQVTRTGNLAVGNAAIGANQAASLRYFHHDQLGSIAAISNEAGAEIERLAYDPWGKRRSVNGLSDVTDSLVGLTTDRGFTMHEHLDEMGVVHMNGRIYDPLIGRFMSADPIIQAPGMLQSHNRYAYVMNNPLNLTDPSGFSWWTRFRDKILKPVVIAYVGYLTGGLIANQLGLGGLLGGAGGTAFATGNAGLTTLGGVVAGAGGGFVAGALSSGTLEGGLRGAFTGGVFGGISATGAANGWGSGGYVAAHAAGGCITSVAGGGSCGSGAASAAFGKFTTLQTESLSTGIGQFAASVVAGGVGSVIAGGKFENGAVTAAYAYLFNNCLANATGCIRAVQTFGNHLVTKWGYAATQIVWELGAAEGAIASGAGIALKAKIADELVGGITNAHHAWPKYLGGAEAQDLVELPKTLHQAYHAGLDKIAPRWEGAAGFNALSVNEQAQRLLNFQTYTQWFDKAFGTNVMGAAQRAGFACSGKIPGHGC